MNIGRETAVDQSGDHMRQTNQKISGKPRRRTRATNFGASETSTVKYDHGGKPLWPSERGEADQHRLGNGGGLMGGAYDAHLPTKIKEKQGRRTRARNSGVIGDTNGQI